MESFPLYKYGVASLFLDSIIAFANLLIELICSCLSCVLQLRLRIYLLIKYGVVSLILCSIIAFANILID